MSRLTFGIDPDSEAHGVAIYHESRLVALNQLDLMGLMECVRQNLNAGHAVRMAIENVLHTNAVYSKNEKPGKYSHAKVALSVGRCQQAQMEVMRMCDYLGVPYTVIKPGGGNWAEDKAMFERVTGWTKKSNADTRSAAFFGFLVAGTKSGLSYYRGLGGDTGGE